MKYFKYTDSLDRTHIVEGASIPAEFDIEEDTCNCASTMTEASFDEFGCQCYQDLSDDTDPNFGQVRWDITEITRQQFESMRSVATLASDDSIIFPS